MKKQILLLIALFISVNVFAQSGSINCNNVTYYADTFYVSLNNATISDTIYYNDSIGMAYPIQCLILSDTSIITASTTFSTDSCFIYTFLAANSTDDTVHFTYNINFKSSSFPNNTVVNAFYHLYRISLGDTTANCYYPVTIILQNTTGINDIEQNPISIYPNPVSSILSVKINSSQKLQFCLFNVLGEKLMENNLSQKINSIDVSNFARGCYFYKVYSDSNLIKTGKLVKQ